ncbi:MAG: hypothetical protein VB141_10090 [Burkholderia gladioli]
MTTENSRADALTDMQQSALEYAIAVCDAHGAGLYVEALRAILAAHPGQPEPRAEVTHGNTTMGECMASLLDRLEAAELYADRYRYLRERDLDSIDAGGVFAGKTPNNVVLNGADLDAAIDAARAGDAS